MEMSKRVLLGAGLFVITMSWHVEHVHAQSGQDTVDAIYKQQRQQAARERQIQKDMEWTDFQRVQQEQAEYQRQQLEAIRQQAEQQRQLQEQQQQQQEYQRQQRELQELSRTPSPAVVPVTPDSIYPQSTDELPDYALTLKNISDEAKRAEQGPNYSQNAPGLAEIYAQGLQRRENPYQAIVDAAIAEKRHEEMLQAMRQGAAEAAVDQTADEIDRAATEALRAADEAIRQANIALDGTPYASTAPKAIVKGFIEKNILTMLFIAFVSAAAVAYFHERKKGKGVPRQDG